MKIINNFNGSVTYLSNDKVSAIIINHKALIDHIYDRNSNRHELRKEIFKFRPKASNTQNKRKRSAATNSDNQGQMSLFDLQSQVNSILDYCKENNVFKTNEDESKDQLGMLESDMPCYNLPVLKGENPSEEVVKTIISNREYLIPPKCKFFNNNIENVKEFILNTEKFDFIVLDPPWWNKYIRRAKASSKGQNGYSMLENKMIENIPIEEMIHENTIVVIWCTNSPSHRKSTEDEFLPKWNLKLLCKWYWIKLNSDYEPICSFNEPGQKQPYEQIYIACANTCNSNKTLELQDKKLLISVASTIHSHKPPLLEIFRNYLPENPKCLELFARYLHPNFTSFGLEVLKLQDTFYYNIK